MNAESLYMSRICRVLRPSAAVLLSFVVAVVIVARAGSDDLQLSDDDKCEDEDFHCDPGAKMELMLPLRLLLTFPTMSVSSSTMAVFSRISCC